MITQVSQPPRRLSFTARHFLSIYLALMAVVVIALIVVHWTIKGTP